MAAAVLYGHHHLLVTSSPSSSPPRHFLSFPSPVPPRSPLRCSVPTRGLAVREARPRRLGDSSRTRHHSGAGGESEEEEGEFVVVSFYNFVRVEDPHAEVARHLHFLEGHDIHGRIYINEQGINAQWSTERCSGICGVA